MIVIFYRSDLNHMDGSSIFLFSFMGTFSCLSGLFSFFGTFSSVRVI